MSSLDIRSTLRIFLLLVSLDVVVVGAPHSACRYTRDSMGLRRRYELPRIIEHTFA
jgi:hypothetical protein